MRLLCGEGRAAIKVSLTVIPAHGKQKVGIQILLKDIRCGGEGMQYSASVFSSLLNTTEFGDRSARSEGIAKPLSKSQCYQF